MIVHTSRDIRAVASQLVKLWVETFRKEKAAGVLTKPLSSGFKAARKMAKMKAGLKLETETRDRTLTLAASGGAPGHPNSEKENFQLGSNAPDSADTEKKDSMTVCEDMSQKEHVPISDSEAAALAAAEAAQAAADAAVKVRMISPFIYSLHSLMQHTTLLMFLIDVCCIIACFIIEFHTNMFCVCAGI